MNQSGQSELVNHQHEDANEMCAFVRQTIADLSSKRSIKQLVFNMVVVLNLTTLKNTWHKLILMGH